MFCICFWCFLASAWFLIRLSDVFSRCGMLRVVLCGLRIVCNVCVMCFVLLLRSVVCVVVVVFVLCVVSVAFA